jgi:hypothetical protein
VAYIKPSWFFAKIFNRITLATGAVNSEPMTVIKRGSKLPQTIPMTPVEVDGVKYLGVGPRRNRMGEERAR